MKNFTETKKILPILPSVKLFSEKAYNIRLTTYLFLGNIKKISYLKVTLSYLFFLGRSVSLGNTQVRAKSLIYRGFGRLGNVFFKKEFHYFFVAVFLYSCSPIYQITEEDRKNYKKYPEVLLIENGHYKAVKAIRIEKTDSIRKDFEEDIIQEIQQEINP